MLQCVNSLWCFAASLDISRERVLTALMSSAASACVMLRSSNLDLSYPACRCCPSALIILKTSTVTCGSVGDLY